MSHPVPEEPHIKITMQMMYREQQETNKLLATTVGHLESLQDLPERVRALELAAAKQQVTTADLKDTQSRSRSALVTAILAVGTAVTSFIFK